MLLYIYFIYAGVTELAALSLSASGGRCSENEKAQRSKFIGDISRNKLWVPQESRRVRLQNCSCMHFKVIYAGVAELADALALGASANACRFKSSHPHQSGCSYRTLVFYKNTLIFLPQNSLILCCIWLITNTYTLSRVHCNLWHRN